MRRLNVKLTVILLVVGVSSVIGVYFLHGEQMKGNAGSLLIRATASKAEYEELTEEKQFVDAAAKLLEAKRLYLRYLAFQTGNEESTEAAEELALICAKILRTPAMERNEHGSAYSILMNTTQKYPELLKVRLEAISVSNIREAISHINYILKKANDPAHEDFFKNEERVKNGGLERLLAILYVQSDNADEAVRILNLLVGYDASNDSFDSNKATAPKNLNAYALLANVYRTRYQGNRDELADRALKQMVKVNPDNYMSYVLRGQYLIDLKDFDKARIDVEKAVEMEDSKRATIRLGALFALSQGDNKKAIPLLERGIRLFPEIEVLHHWRADIARRYGKGEGQGDPLEAKKIILRGLEAVPNGQTLLKMKADLELAEGLIEDARSTLKEMKKNGVNRGLIQYVEARILLSEGKDFIEAIRLMEKALLNLPDEDHLTRRYANRILARGYVRLQQWDRVVSIYQKMLAKNSKAHDIRLKLAGRLINLGQYKAGEAQFKIVMDELGEDFYKMNNGQAIFQTYLNYRVSEQLSKKKDSQKWGQVNQIIRNYKDAAEPSKFALLDTICRLQIRQKNFEDALNRVKEMKLLKEGKDDKTRISFALQIREIGLIEQIEKLGGVDGAITKLDEMEKEFSEPKFDWALLSTRINLNAKKGEADFADKLAKFEEQIDSLDPKLHLSAWHFFASRYQSLRDFDRARDFLHRIADKQPYDLVVRLKLFDLATLTSDASAIQEALDDIEQLMGRGSATWQYYEARRLLGQVQGNENAETIIEEIRSLLDKASQKRPNWHVLAQLEASVSMIQEDLPRAVEYWEKAHKTGPASERSVERLMQHYVRRGEFDKARTVMGLLPDRTSNKMSKLRIKFNLLTNEPEKATSDAMVLMKELEEKKISRATDYAWFGAVMAQLEKPGEAEKAWIKAVEANPKQPTYWLSVITQLAANGKLEEATKYMHKLRLALPSDQVPSLLAQCYRRLGRFSDAERIYLENVEASDGSLAPVYHMANFYISTNNRSKANKYLNRILNDHSGNMQEEQFHFWARREKAKQLAATRNHQDFLDARRLLRANYVDGKPGSADLLVEVSILAARSEPAFATEAIDKIKRIRDASRTGRISPRLQLVLAQLYDRTGDWTRARKEMDTLIRKEGSNIQYLQVYFEMAMQRNELVTAEDKLKQIKRMNSKGIQTKVNDARLRHKRGDTKKAVEIISSLIPKSYKVKDSISLQKIKLLHLLANEFQKMEELAAAENLFRAYVIHRPQDKLSVLAPFLARRGGEKNIDAALAICESELPKKGDITKRPEPVLRIGVELFRHSQGELSAAHKARIEKWFKRANRDNPDSISIELMTASLRDVQGKYKEALQIYKHLMTLLTDKKLQWQQRAIVRNNIAYFLVITDGDTDAALQQISDAVSEMGPSSDLLDTFGMVYIARGNSSKALEYLKRSVSGGGSAPKYFHLALAHQAANDKNAAKLALEQAKAYDLDDDSLRPWEKSRYNRLFSFVNTK